METQLTGLAPEEVCTMSIEIMLSPAALAWIGGAFQNKTRISPMSNLDPSSFTLQDREALAGRGILDSKGVLNPVYYPALRELAAASAYCRVRYSAGTAVIERSTYFGPGGIVSIDNTPDGLLIEYPAGSERYLEGLTQFTGASSLMNSELSVEMDYEPALVLATIIDMRRRDVLRSYADAAGGFVPRPYHLEDILQALTSATDNPRWLGTVVRRMKADAQADASGALPSLPRSAVEAALATLLPDVVASGSGWDLAGDAAAFASSFLVVDGIMHVQTGAEGSRGDFHAAECVFMQAGLHDIVCVDGGGGKVSIETISGARLQEFVRKFLTTAPSFD